MVSPQSQILVVEDEADIRDLMMLHLLRKGYTVTGVESGEEALEQLENQQFDLIVLDWMLPGKTGIDVLANLPGDDTKVCPSVLMVTAKAESEYIVKGLQAGADDYLAKPFDPTVFIARCEALLRRRPSKNANQSSDDITIGELVIRPEYFEVKCQEKLIELTKSEFKLLHALARHDGRVLTRDRLIELVQGEGIMVIDRTIDTHVFSLRKKLGVCAGFIETIHGVGYRINAKKK